MTEEELKASNAFINKTEISTKIGVNLGFDYVLGHRLGGPIYMQSFIRYNSKINYELNELMKKQPMTIAETIKENNIIEYVLSCARLKIW